MSRCSCLLIRERIFSMGTMLRKTNILEAVYLCGTTKSHKGSKDREMIRFGEEEAHIRMAISRSQSAYEIDMHLKKNRPKGIAVNGVPIRKAAELLGIANFVFSHRRILVSLKTDRRSGGVLLIWNFVSWISFTYTSFPITIK